MSDAEELVQLRYEGAVAVLTLNNPKRMNAMGLALREAFLERLMEAHRNDACRVLVLTGAEGNFTSGGDVSEMKKREVIAGRLRMELPTSIFRQLVTGPKPVISAVEGVAFGAGVALVAASDYAVAATDARFSCAFIKVGILPDFGGLWSIPRKVGQRKAWEMAAFADTYTAQQALEMQLINRTCEPGKALEAALETADRLAKSPPMALALLRSAMNSGADGVEQAIATEISYQSVLTHTDDFEEAARAFMEKRKPNFTGR
jgi:enoyl-CoA hydratase/carnithine racemase